MDYLNEMFMKVVSKTDGKVIQSLPNKMQEKIALKKVEMKKSLDEVEADILASETRVNTRRSRITEISDQDLKKGMYNVYVSYLQKCNQGKTMRDEAAMISSKTHSNCDEYATLIASKWADAVIETISHNKYEKSLKDKEDAFSSFY
jgi:protoporphyrinogen oxidase